MSAANAAALAAVHALVDVDAGMYSHLAFKSRSGVLNEPRDLSFASALFYGTLERKRILDEILRPYLKGGVEKLDPEVRAVLRTGVYRQIFMQTRNEAAPVSDSVEICRKVKKRSACGLVNAVLRKTSSFRRENIAGFPVQVRLSVCDELYEKTVSCYGDRAEALLEATLVREKDAVRVNTLRTSGAELIRALSDEGVAAETAELPDALLVSGGYVRTQAFRNGLFHVIGLPAQTAARALGAQPGERILDLCAAPGGKTMVLAQEMNNCGEIVAIDKYPARVRLIEENASRLGITCIRTMVADSSRDLTELGLFDRVLCDVPCSGFGELSKKPELRYKDPAASAELPELQAKLLDNAASLVRKNGRVVYSTCTIFPQENEEIAKAFLEKHPGFAPAVIADVHGQNASVLYLPGKGGNEGFYIASFERVW